VARSTATSEPVLAIATAATSIAAAFAAATAVANAAKPA